MANFNTHLAVGATVSGIAATSCLTAELAQPQEVMLYFALGTLGGLLPDLDSDNSVLLNVIFNIFAVIFAFTAMFSRAGIYSLAELLSIWLVCFLALRFGIFTFFKRFTQHRGIFHSLPAGVLAWLLVTFVCWKLLKLTDVKAWMCGFFVCIGYLVHLILDEIYSVDLNNKKIKRSLGTALKLADLKNVAGSIILYVAIVGMFLLVPRPNNFIQSVFSQSTYMKIERNLLPKNGKWFYIP